MDSGRLLVVLTRSLSPSAARTIEGWRTADVQVEVVSGSPRELVEKLDAAPAQGVALWSPDPGLEHALGRSLRHQHTPVVVFFEAAEGLSSGAEFEAPFFEDAPPPIPPAAVWNAMLHRLLADERVRFVFRTRWHAQALAHRLGFSSFPRASVIAPGLQLAERAPTQPVRVLFPGVVAGARGCGADLFVRTVIELSHRPRFEQLEFAILEDQVRDERVLAPLAGLPVRKLQRAEALRSASLALVTARDGTALGRALDSAAHGVLPLALAHPALEAFIPASVLLPDDPAVIADEVCRRRDKPAETEALRLGLIRRLQAHCAPGKARDAELKTFAPRTKTARARAAAKPPVLTVGVPAWNAAAWLDRCVSSLLRAGEPGLLEIIVVDDGSTDETSTVARRLARAHSRTVRLLRQENKGHGGAINAALGAARGEYFRVVDADDWVDSVAFAQLISALRHETADLVLTGYAEDRPDEPLPLPMRTLGRLPAGAVTRFDTVLDPLFGLTSWGPILSTSTFRTTLLRQAKLRLTENSAYVDLEYCTLGLEFVETMRHLPLDLYRYSLDVEGQSVTPESYRKRFRQHEAVIVRLCEFVSRSPHLSAMKRRYIAERVLTPVVATHVEIVLALVGDAKEARAFRKRMKAFAFVPLPPERAMRKLATRAARAALPEHLVEALTGAPDRGPAELARELGRYVLPSALTRFLVRRNTD